MNYDTKIIKSLKKRLIRDSKIKCIMTAMIVKPEKISNEMITFL
jgi:hypothetical protein